MRFAPLAQILRGNSVKKQATQLQAALRIDLPGSKASGRSGPAHVIHMAPKLRGQDQTAAEEIDFYSRGQLHFHMGQFRNAYEDFCRAALQRPQLASCWVMASRCLVHGGKSGRALALLEEALKRQGWDDTERGRLQEEIVRQRRRLSKAAVTPQFEGAEDAPAEEKSAATETTPETARPAAEAKPQEARQAAAATVDLYAAPTSKLVTIPFTLLVVGVIVAGFWQRGEGNLTAESGLGYLLGIVGSLLMVVLMLYPMRKKMRFMRNWGPIPHWFRFHMLAGIIGPVMILFHANFQLGSLNSRVVLGSTLLVAASGIFGRYLYTKIHYGLYGKRMSLEQLHQAISTNQDNLAAVFIYAPKIQARLLRFDELVLSPSRGVLHSIGRVLLIDLLRRWTELRIQLVLRRALRVAARRNHWSRRETARQYRAANLLIKRHFIAVMKVAEFSFYERFFSLWHIFHMPLFLLLLIALVMHVIAVHMY